jgi:hypothetical protein
MAAVLTANSGPLQRTDVIADPVWVLHVDCDALKQAALGKALMAELEKPEAEKKFAAVQAIFNVDPRKDLHGVTIYGATKAESDGVVVAYADFDAARLVTLVQANKDYESTKHGANTIHSWIDEKKKEKDGVKPRTYGAIYKGKVLILGQKETRVAEALDVMDGSKPNLTGSAQFAQLGANGGGFIIGAARKLDLPGNDPGATVLKQAKAFWLNVGESQGRAEVKLNLEAEDAEVAKQMGDVCRGLVALLTLQKDKPEAVKLAQGLTISQAEKTVSAKLSLPAEDVVAMIKDKVAKKSADE